MYMSDYHCGFDYHSITEDTQATPHQSIDISDYREELVLILSSA